MKMSPWLPASEASEVRKATDEKERAVKQSFNKQRKQHNSTVMRRVIYQLINCGYSNPGAAFSLTMKLLIATFILMINLFDVRGQRSPCCIGGRLAGHICPLCLCLVL